MHRLAIGLGILGLLTGLLLVFVGGVAAIFTLTGFAAVGVGILVAAVGGLVTLAGVYL